MKYETITVPSLSFPNLCKLCPNKEFSLFLLQSDCHFYSVVSLFSDLIEVL